MKEREGDDDEGGSNNRISHSLVDTLSGPGTWLSASYLEQCWSSQRTSGLDSSIIFGLEMRKQIIFRRAKYLAKVTQPGNAWAGGQSQVSLQPCLCFSYQAQSASSHVDKGYQHQPKLLKDLGTSQAIPSGHLPYWKAGWEIPAPPLMGEPGWRQRIQLTIFLSMWCMIYHEHRYLPYPLLSQTFTLVLASSWDSPSYPSLLAYFSGQLSLPQRSPVWPLASYALVPHNTTCLPFAVQLLTVTATLPFCFG